MVPLKSTYFKKAQIVKKLPNIIDDLCSDNKFLPHFVIENEIQITLSISCFLQKKNRRNCTFGNTLIISENYDNNCNFAT